MLIVGGVIIGSSKDCSHVGGVTANVNDFVAVKGLAAFKFVIFADISIVKVSATRIILSNQFITIDNELNVTKVVLPLRDPSTFIVYTRSLELHIDSDEAIVNAGIVYETAV